MSLAHEYGYTLTRITEDGEIIFDIASFGAGDAATKLFWRHYDLEHVAIALKAFDKGHKAGWDRAKRGVSNRLM